MNPWVIVVGGIILIVLLIIGAVVSSSSEQRLVEQRLDQYLDGGIRQPLIAKPRIRL